MMYSRHTALLIALTIGACGASGEDDGSRFSQVPTQIDYFRTEGGTESLNMTWSFAYDESGRITNIARYGVGLDQTRETRVIYAEDGTVASVESWKQTRQDAGPVKNFAETMRYGDAGRLVQIDRAGYLGNNPPWIDDIGRWEFDYDDAGRRQTVRRYLRTQVLSTTESYSWNEDGTLASSIELQEIGTEENPPPYNEYRFTWTDGALVRYERDFRGELSNRRTIERDADGRYTAEDRYKRIDFGYSAGVNGVFEAVYDDAGRLAGWQRRDSQNNVIARYVIQWKDGHKVPDYLDFVAAQPYGVAWEQLSWYGLVDW